MANEIEKNNRLTNDDVSDLLKEIVDPNSIDVEHLNKKDELCPNIWDSEDKLNQEVRGILLKNAKAFIEYLKLGELKFKDITLTGSLANYNWTEHSDVDIHILLDYNQISEDDEFVSDYFKAKKYIWSEDVPVEVKGHEVEVYIQNINEPHASTGVYSLIKNLWLTKPIKTMISIDTVNIQLKAADIMNCIDELENIEDDVVIIDMVSSVMDKLKKMRKSGLEDVGEFSTENLVFKLLRNNGYLEKMLKIKNNSIKSELTLESFSFKSQYYDLITESTLQDKLRKLKNAGVLSVGLVVGLLSANVSKDAILATGIPQELILKAENIINTTFNDYLSNDNNKELNTINNNEKELHNTQDSIR